MDQFPVTIFRDHAAQFKTECSVTIETLLERIRVTTATTKAALPWIKLARFGNAKTPKGSLRHDANVIAITGVEVDYDGEEIGFDRAVEMAETEWLRALIYTSPSHTPDKPRWRVLCPTSRELPPAQRHALVSRLNGLYK